MVGTDSASGLAARACMPRAQQLLGQEPATIRPSLVFIRNLGEFDQGVERSGPGFARSNAAARAYAACLSSVSTSLQTAQ